MTDQHKDEKYPPDTPEANARARAEGQTIALPPTCGRIMVGSGTDTYDPICELVEGHVGPCKSTAARDQHRIDPVCAVCGYLFRRHPMLPCRCGAMEPS